MNEKKRVAAGSVVVALFLTAFKLVVGVLTGSLGILSEAAHSGLDLLAALMTWFAVSVSGKPADPEHPYGHQKIENLSALFETLLLMVTCVWIVYEAVERLFFKPVHIQVNFWSYLVVGTAIVMDFTRSRLLYKVARKTHSAALEADALHFSSDIASSAVVGMGLIFTQLGFPHADPIAALGVSFFVLVICYRLGVKAIHTLVDKVSPEHIRRAEAAALRVPGVLRAYDIRVREAGDQHFVDLKVAARPTEGFEAVHRLTEAVEEAVRRSFRNADVLVHAEPEESEGAGLWEKMVAAAEKVEARIHDLQVHETPGGRDLAVHMEWLEDLPFADAHEKASRFESGIKEAFPDLRAVTTHLECAGGILPGRADVTSQEGTLLGKIVERIRSEPGVGGILDPRIVEGEGHLWVSLTCLVDPGLRLSQAHLVASLVEERVRSLDSRIASVTVHTECAADRKKTE